MKKISILGSTGSIGTQALDIVAQHPETFQVVGLAAGNNLDVIRQQVATFKPLVVSVGKESDASALRQQFPKIEILVGDEGNQKVASCSDADFVISAIVGAAGLRPTMAAIQAGKTVALANKESMVIAGELMNRLAAEKKVSIIPIDSEHSAIFQCLQGNRLKDVKRIILTASGGPFLHRDSKTFAEITLEEALKHPNWKMGSKITIDSATLMNKGLEVIEAAWLFGMPSEKVSVVVHPQSIVHSMVEYIDGSVMAQLGVPDMRCAISYAMAYPERVTSGVKSLDLTESGTLTFFKPDMEKFRCLALAFEALKIGMTMPVVLNAANEVAVDAFLNRKIRFVEIPKIIEETMLAHEPKEQKTLEDILAADSWSRTMATQILRKVEK